MDLYHVYHTTPSLEIDGQKINDNYYMPDYELVVAFLSVLYWKKYNGKAILVSDQNFINFLEKIGALELDLWDEFKHLPYIPNSFDKRTFWAAPKLYTLRELKTPFVIMDMDAYYMKKFRNTSSDLVFGHYEDINFPLYPDPNFIIKKKDIFDKYDFQWNRFAINAAFIYFNNQQFLDEYTSKTIEFMEYSEHSPKKYDKDCVVPYEICFIEQRFLGELSAWYEENYPDFKREEIIKDIYIHGEFGKFLPNREGESNISEATRYYDHIWGLKKGVKRSNKAYEEHMYYVIELLMNHFTEHFDGIMKVLDNLNNFSKDILDKKYNKFL